MVKSALANSAWWLAGAPSCAAFAAALDDPSAAQEQILLRSLRVNAGTAFGRAHGFADIHSVEEYARRVPIRDYDEMRPWIERIRLGESNVLTRDPVTRLVPTSGSTASRKLIPWTGSMQGQLNRAIGPWIFDLYRRNPGAMAGSSYWSVTPAVAEPPSDNETSAPPIGFDDDADYLGGWRKRLVDCVMAVPPQVKRISSIDAWRYVTLLMLLRRRDLSLISIWHPSFLQLLLSALEPNWGRLLADVAAGVCSIGNDLPTGFLTSLPLHPDPNRAAELERIGPRSAMALWPNLKVISCWADGNAAHAAESLPTQFSGAFIQPKGLLATEGIVSIPYAGLHPLAIRSHYFEFEDDTGRVRPASELQTGATYGVLLTTMGGLYRYRLHDLIRVDGRAGQTPSVRFIGKSGMVSDLMGEKLTDGFVADVLARLLSRYPARPTFTLLAPNTGDEGSRYTLYINDHLPANAAIELDESLSANPQYAYCRRLGQLLAPTLCRVAGDAYPAYCARLAESGQRLGDIKPAALSKLDGWSGYLPAAPDPARENGHIQAFISKISS